MVLKDWSRSCDDYNCTAGVIVVVNVLHVFSCGVMGQFEGDENEHC